MFISQGGRGVVPAAVATLALILAACAEPTDTEATKLPSCTPGLPDFVLTHLEAAEDRVDIASVAQVGDVDFLTDDGSSSQPAYSPNGRTIAFVHSAFPGAEQRDHELWLMNQDGSDPRSVEGPRGVGAPEFSPDGTMIVLSQLTGADEGLLAKITVVRTDGGQLATVSPALDPGEMATDAAATWAPHGDMLALLRRVDLPGGAVRSEVWTTAWPQIAFKKVYESETIARGVVWGPSETELLLSDWDAPGASEPKHRVLIAVKTTDLNDFQTIATSAGPPSMHQGGVYYFRYGQDENTLAELNRVNDDGAASVVARLQLNPVDSPRWTPCG